MSYNEKLYGNKLRPRFRDWTEFNAFQDAQGIDKSLREIPLPEQDDMNWFTKLPQNLNFDALGWDLEPDGSIPKDKAGNSRLFALHTGEDGTEELVPLDGKKPPLGSQAFWDDVQRGNVFAFPAGDTKPVQIQLSYGGQAELSFSKPLDPKELPLRSPPPEPRRPNIFKRAIHAVFRGAFKQEFDTYAQQKAESDRIRENRKAVTDKAEKLSDSRAGVQAQEKAEAEAEKKVRAEAAERQRLQDQLKDAQKNVGIVDRSMARAKAAWEPEPKVIELEETKQLFPGRTIKAGEDSVYDRLYARQETNPVTGKLESREGYFNKKTQGDVKPIGKEELDLSSIPKGNSGKTFDTEDFVALTLGATSIPRIGVNSLGYTSSRDVTLPEAMQKLKKTVMVDGKPVEKPLFTKDEAMMLASDTAGAHYITDVMDEPPRDNSGRFAKPVVEPARQLTKDALNQYKNGDPKALAEIIAHGIRRTSSDITAEENLPGNSLKAQVKYAGKLVEMLDADPKLREAAREAGMRDKDVDAVRGMNEVVRLDEKGLKANLKLAQAAAEGKDLPPEEKKQAVKDMLVGKIAVESFVKENQNKACPEADEALMGPMFMQGYGKGGADKKVAQEIKKMEASGQPRPMPPEGKLYYDTGGNVILSYKGNVKERPAAAILASSPTYRKNIEKVAEQILREDKLLQKSPDQLVQTLDYTTSATRTETGARAMGMMSQQGMLDKAHREQMAREVKDPARAQELAEAFAANQAQVPKQEAPQKQGELAPKEQAAEGLAV